ncbi:MAG: (2Fe-2S)-binding protein [Planctomycetaceae bacterium]|nr:(2Fe-2S)-binding protein [Planctomycetaceae bacterium]
MPTVTFKNLKKKIIVPEGANLRKEAHKNGISMHSGPHRYLNCFGNGMCASCRVKVVSGGENLKRKTWWEKYVLPILNPVWFFARIGNEQTLTLACQSRVMGDCEIEATPEMNLHGEPFWS